MTIATFKPRRCNSSIVSFDPSLMVSATADDTRDPIIHHDEHGCFRFVLQARHFGAFLLTKIQTLVLGVGNTLMSDEGVGVHVVERLVKNFDMPKEVQVLDGGTLGMDLLYYLEGVPNLLIIDAIQANREPGYLLRLANEQVPAFLSMKMSPHQIGVPDMLATARLRGTTPPNIVLWGVQPERIEIGLELSETLTPLVDVLVENARDELARWGHSISPKKPVEE